ncbi:biotin transporter BioY [Enemella sp. A6]|uniref:biotin transporter BioY n=1 Tax=Enemella sp. A6 TaxID=3440152 RepID=UPI003EBC4966
MSYPSRDRSEWSQLDLALIAVFAALIAALSLTPAIPVGSLGVPITLQTLGVALTGLILGPIRGLLATLLYLAIGFAGLPVFAGFTSTWAVLAKPSAGYLLSFPLAALVAGLVSRALMRRFRMQHNFAWFFIGAMVASVVTHIFGIIGMSLILQISLSAAAIGDLAYVPGDIAKDLVASAIAVAVLKAFPHIVLHRRRVTTLQPG